MGEGSGKLTLNIIANLFQYLQIKENFELHLVSKKVQQKYWEYLHTELFTESRFSFKDLQDSEKNLLSLTTDTLLSIIQASRYHLILSSLSSACLTLLNKHYRYNFSGLDFSGARISNSGLSFGIIQHTNFSNTLLTNVNFSRSYLNDCNFSGASMNNVDFGTRVFSGHLQTISALAASSDGKILSSAGYDKLIKIWRLPDCTLLKTLKGHTQPICSLALSADGTILISSSESIRIWDVSTGLCQVLKGHINKITGVSMCSGNGIFVSCSADETLKLWQTDIGKCKKTFQFLTPLQAVMLSEDGKLIAVGGSNGEVSVLDCKGIVQCRHKVHLLPVRTVFINRKYVASGSDEGLVVLYEMQSGSVREYLGHSLYVTCVKIFNEFIYSCGGGSIRKWDINSARCVDVIVINTQAINSLVILGEDFIISAGQEKTIRFSKSTNQDVIADWIECVVISDNGHSVIAGCKNGLVRKWKEGRCTQVWDFKSKIMSVDTSEGYIAVGCWDMNIYIREEGEIEGQGEKTLVGHNDGVNCLQFMKDYLFSGGNDGLVKIWDWKEGYCVNTLQIHGEYVHRVVANSRYAVSSNGCSNSKITIWDLESDTFATFYKHKGRVKALSLSDTVFASGGEDGITAIWDYQGNTIRNFSKHTAAITEVAFYMDNLISCAEDMCVYVWDWTSDNIIAKCSGIILNRVCGSLGTFTACEFNGNSLKLYECQFLENRLVYNLLWRSVSMLECRLCTFEKARGLTDDITEFLFT